MPDSESAALLCRGLKKHFGATSALADATLHVRRAAIHALVGENGAGKSTLLNCIAGLLKPDAGELFVFGQAVRYRSPLDAAAAGIGVVHQHFLLAEALTVAENVALGVRRSAGGLRFDRQKAARELAALAARTGLDVDPHARVADLSIGLRQRVEILKALSRGAKILLLDEPTAVLAPPEVERLFETLRALRDEGRTIVIVTHKLNEIFVLAHDVTVLRGGRTVFEGELRDSTPAALAEKMIGRETPRLRVGRASPPVSGALTGGTPIPPLTGGTPIPPLAGGTPVPAPPAVVLDVDALEVRGEAVGAIKESPAAAPRLSIQHLQVRAGEILAVAGVEGNGQPELAALIAGTLPHSQGVRGVLRLDGQDLAPLSVRERSARGLAYVPADRQREGLVLDMPLAENLHLRAPLLRPLPLLSVLDHRAMRERSAGLLAEYGVAPPEPRLRAGALSGGNQQKAVIARELSRAPRLILACNPTRGLDVGAAAEVHNRLLAAAQAQQAAVLLISSDLDEVLLLGDRIAVLYRGVLTVLGVRGLSRDAVGRAMVGAAP